MPDRPTFIIELTPEQYLQLAAATGLLVNELELDVQSLMARVAPRVHIPRLAVKAEAVKELQD